MVKNFPVPTIKSNEVLVKAVFSLISAGIELSGLKASGSFLIKKVLSVSEKL